jgi:serine protease Do
MLAVNNVDARYATDFSEISEKLLPSVVNISTTAKSDVNNAKPDATQRLFEDFFRGSPVRPRFDNPSRKANSLGSGFIISEDGYIVTNNHVIDGADVITVTLHNKKRFEAKLIGQDAKTDLALIKIDTEDDLVATRWGDSNKQKVGQWVIAIGNPFGLGGTVTAGIISALGRDIRDGPYDAYIQTDAAINPGNSGGPMFNMSGEVIGINRSIVTPSGGNVGLGFAVPSHIAKTVVEQIIKYGKPRRGWLGVSIETVNDVIAKSLGLQEASGALVGEVMADGPAQVAGFQAGDVILEFDGQKITEMRALPIIVANTEIGKRVKVLLWRDGKTIVKMVEVGNLEKAEENGLVEVSDNTNGSTQTPNAVVLLGMKLAPISNAIKQKFRIKHEYKGLVVVGFDDSYQQSTANVRVGFTLISINNKPVSSVAMAKKIINSAKKMGAVIGRFANQQGQKMYIGLDLQ